MIYKLWSYNASKLLQKQESGMGYQLISAIPSGSKLLKRYVVYNTELVVDLDDNFQNDKNAIIKEGYKVMLSKSRELILSSDTIMLLNKNSLNETVKLSAVDCITNKRHYGGKGATDNLIHQATGNEVFVRLSAYEDDKRIDFINKRLVEGTYTTTEIDYRDCLSKNDNPVDRYALPNDETIKWAFYVRPVYPDTFQKGIVQPAFGHKGGGIEAYFEKGTSKGTYLEKRGYGK